VAYAAGFGSIGLVLGARLLSRMKTGDEEGLFARWGIFIGHWTPAFMALVVALKLEED